ncbi:MAG: glutamate-cysteine ligase family protein [Methanolinea sp.]|nr:glutamate-cysteine ligase family protein [Methanolinea sp.]
MRIGTEHEYSLNGPGFVPLPESDRVLREVGGGIVEETAFAGVHLCKELQKTVLEFIPPDPSERLADLEIPLLSALSAFSRKFRDRYTLLGLGMHPTLTLDQTSVWDHGESEYYEAYDRLFSLRQHGWLNIQALQINLEYGNEAGMVELHNRVRCLLPYLVAVSAASPFVEGKATGFLDNRLLFYRKNQERVPEICNGIVPEPIASRDDYLARMEGMYAHLRELDAGVLCEEWVASSGEIVRFSRPCIEVKVPDEQECLRADMALCAFLRSLLRAGDPGLPVDQKSLLELTEVAIRKGTMTLGPELSALYRKAESCATAEERSYLPLIRTRIEEGCLAQVLLDEFRETRDLQGIMAKASRCLFENEPYTRDSRS